MEEIKTQNIYINDNIEQYAIVQYISNSNVYEKLCDDCTCTVDIKDSKNTLILDDTSTLESEPGLFTLKATPLYFAPSMTYYALFNCTSVLYGNGFVRSTINILDNPPVSSGLRPSADASSSSIGDFLGEIIGDDTGDSGSLLKRYIADPITKAILDAIGGFTGILKIPKFLGDIANSVSQWIYDITYFLIRFMTVLGELIVSPSTGIRSMMNLLWGLFKPVIYVFSVPIILYEFYVMSHKAVNKDAVGAFKTMLDAQVEIIRTFQNILNVFIRYVSTLLTWLYQLLDTLKFWQ